jgi:eukaryotic-like serine/threonine-protein kinase
MSLPRDPSDVSAAAPEVWLRAKALFGDVVTLPADERAGVLDARCGGDAQLRQFVETLLRSNDALPTGRSESLQSGLGAVLDRAVRQAWPRIAPGRRFGAFAVVEEIGRGGMGIVYLAERHDGKVAQRVALKLVPPEVLHGEAAQRLARERRLLAALEHPHIARLIDAGEDASGIPYFAMEYVQGVSITAHCDQLALPLAERLRLFLQVCAAVQYAHANLIVHCDIKAGNILVSGGGLPKLLDFGIAHTLDAARTESEAGEARFLSPQTAAPEQFLGRPASVATDIYALGILLCELGGGQRPFADTQDRGELRRRVLEDAPALPSQTATGESARRCGGLALPALRRHLAGDIDAIAARALAKSPQQRYASVEQLSADISRHLQHRPVEARAGQRGYRFARFLRRNALAVVFAGAVAGFVLVLAALLASFAASTARQNAQLAHERDQARQREQQAQFERARAQQVTDFVIGLFKAATPREARSPGISARELLDRGSQKLRASLGDQPQLKAAMLSAVSETQLAMDNLDGAEQAAREAFALRGTLQPPAMPDLVDSLRQLAVVANRRGRFAEALALADQGQALALVKSPQTDIVPLLMARAAALGGLQLSKDRLAVLREVLARQQQTYGMHDPRALRAAKEVAGTLSNLGLVAEAEQLLLQHLPSEPAEGAADDPERAEVMISLATIARKKGDSARAETLGGEALAIYRRVYGDQSLETAEVLNAIAIIAHDRGDYARALALFEESTANIRALWPDSPRISGAEYNMGMLLLRLQRPADARRHLQRAVELGERFFPPQHVNLANYRLVLGSALSDLRRYDQAEALLHQALAVFLAINAPRRIDISLARGELACMTLVRGRAGSTAARADLAAALEVMNRHVKPSSLQAARLRGCARRFGVPDAGPSADAVYSGG